MQEGNLLWNIREQAGIEQIVADERICLGKQKKERFGEVTV